MTASSRRNASIAALLIASLLTACGGGGSDGGTTASTTTPTTPTTPVAPVTPVAPTQEPGAPTLQGDTALDGYNWFNYRRVQIGLSALTRNSRIDLAAQGHSVYQRQNNSITHTQNSALPGFTGTDLLDRLNAAGYTLVKPYAYGEVISAAGETSGFYHAEELIGAIYHRFVIFEPVFKEMGTGAASSSNYTYFTTDFGASNGYGTGVGRGNVANYPAANQVQVPRNFFSDTESPDPVPNQNEVGYPISVHADISALLTVQSFTVRPRGGSDLSVRLMVRSNDTETPRSAAAIIPLSVLRANTVYDVSFSGTVDNVPLSRNWSFTTK
ncbi:MAG: CAP domain-containing protein [Pseudomonadota bacterium]